MAVTKTFEVLWKLQICSMSHQPKDVLSLLLICQRRRAGNRFFHESSIISKVVQETQKKIHVVLRGKYKKP